jgi:uncharacterized membrane protein YdjX (TVP38/TMEM64 family)
VKTSKIALILLILLAFFGFFYFDLAKFLTLEGLKAQQAIISQDLNEHYLFYFSSFCLIYIISTALSLPGAALLTLLGGGLFGLVMGTIAVSFSSTMGATIAFWSARFLFKDSVEKRFSSSLEKINTGIEKEGGFYLFSIRLMPVFPFFMVNLIMGLTNIKTLTYMWVSALGMFPGTVAYVNAGTQLSQLDSLSGLMSPSLIGAFVILGLVPIVSKKIVQTLRNKPIKEVHN